MMDFFKDFFAYLRERKKWWLVPVIVFLLLFGTLIILSSGSALAPFIYTLFQLAMTPSKKYEALLVISTALLVIYLIGHLKHGDARELYLYLACGIGISGIALRRLGDLVARGWYKLADLLSLLTSKIIMTLVFVVVLIPVSALYRLFKKDRLKLRKSAESGWTIRNHRFESGDLKNIW